jgi:hypothetical protein
MIVLVTGATFAAGCGGDTQSVSASVCASGTKWSGGDHGSELMHPGRDCIACHEQEGRGPRFTLAGTVHAQQHEADDCFGVSGVTVQVTDANQKVVLTLTTNEAGNFFTEAAVAKPYKIQVLGSGKSNAMAAAQTSGECASCHTQEGANGAPGRVQAP